MLCQPNIRDRTLSKSAVFCLFFSNTEHIYEEIDDDCDPQEDSQTYVKEIRPSGSESKLTIYDSDEDEEIEDEQVDDKTLLVCDLPDNTDEETIEMFFESKKKSGGGSIQRLDFKKEKREAVIEFRNWKGNLNFII